VAISRAVRAFLQERRFGVLATINRDGLPQQTAMWYELQGDEIMLNTARGRLKETNLRRDPRVSLCVEDGYTYVTVAGRVRLIDDQETAQADIARLARRYEGAEDAARQIERFRTETRVTIRLAIERAIEDGFDED
jgi:PPOX class probable F420-dependent enzyme